MDEAHVGAAIRYVLLNPVRAGLCRQARDWPWSSIGAHLGIPDGVTDPDPVATHFPELEALLTAEEDEERTLRLRRAETIGRPVGEDDFIAHLEAATGRSLSPKPRGRKPGPK